MSTKIEALVSEIKEMQSKFREQGQELIREAFKEFFQNYPNVKSIWWEQYTPYFNDGEPCEFSRHDAHFYLESFSSPELEKYCEDHFNDSSYEGHELALGRLITRPSYYKDTPVIEVSDDEVSCYNAFNQLIKCLWARELESLFQDLFSDHVRVIVTRSGVETEEVEHD